MRLPIPVIMSAMKLKKEFLIFKTATFCLLLAMSCLAQNESKIPSDFPSLKKLSAAELEIKTQAHVKLWGLGSSDRWDLLQAQGDLVFTFADGLKAVAPAQIIGTYNSKDQSWLWAWANDSINDSLKKDAQKVREYGAKHRIKQLTERKWLGSEAEAWAMAAVAVKLCGAQGAYRGPASENLFVFMTFGEVQLSKK
jgi:hypothetical protein